MKKYLPFLVKALLNAFYASIPVMVFVMCLSDHLYTRNAASSFVPLWAKVTTVVSSKNAQMLNDDYSNARNVVILTPEQFKQTFGEGDIIVASIEPRGVLVRYRADKGRTAFTASEKLLNPPDGTSIVQTSLIAGGRAIRMDLEPESVVSIIFTSLFVSLCSAISLGCIIFIGESIADNIMLKIKRWRNQKIKPGFGSTAVSA